MNRRKAVFFDRDGVVNYRIVGGYVRKPEEFRFIPDFLDFFPILKKSGIPAIIISNQQGVGKGIMSLEELSGVHAVMQKQLNELTGFSFDDIFICTDLESANSNRRKPKPGMILEALAKWGLNAENSWMIGDSASDVEAGRVAGLNTILLSNKYNDKSCDADFIFKNFYDIIASGAIKLNN
jgi:D-glycero-D-manno-heptose 1,7-bisphosphate phosphatase